MSDTLKKQMPQAVFQRLRARVSAELPDVVYLPVGTAAMFSTNSPTEGEVWIRLQTSLSGEFKAGRTKWTETPLDCEWEVVHKHPWWQLSEEQTLFLAALVMDRVPITITMESCEGQGHWQVSFAGFVLSLSFKLCARTGKGEQKLARAIDVLLSRIPLFTQTPKAVAQACMRMRKDCALGDAVPASIDASAGPLMRVTIDHINC